MFVDYNYYIWQRKLAESGTNGTGKINKIVVIPHNHGFDSFSLLCGVVDA